MKLSTSALAALLLLSSAGLVYADAPAGTPAAAAVKHPRRKQVNSRLKNQDKRINKEEKSGEISKGQAHKLHKKDHTIRKEEKDMAKNDGGHISKGEQKDLNHQENKVSNEIGK